MPPQFKRCPECREYRHEYLFPWLDFDGDYRASPPRSDSPRAVAAYAVRIAQAAEIRATAQAKGRDYARCIPCRNGDSA